MKHNILVSKFFLLFVLLFTALSLNSCFYHEHDGYRHHHGYDRDHDGHHEGHNDDHEHHDDGHH